MLVCGSSGMSAESVKKLRWSVESKGFLCQQQQGGWLCFSAEAPNPDWKGLLKELSGAPDIKPVYFQLGSRRLAVGYGLSCIKSNLHMSQSLLKIMKVLFWFNLRQRRSVADKLIR